jgi:hypothetical protein
MERTEPGKGFKPPDSGRFEHVRKKGLTGVTWMKYNSEEKKKEFLHIPAGTTLQEAATLINEFLGVATKTE